MKSALVAALLVATFALSAGATLYIDTFDVAIELLPDGRVQIEEVLHVVFVSAHHGIERWIPVSYRSPQGARVTIDFHLDGVTLDGRSVPYVARRSGPDEYLRIGDADSTVSGLHTYSIAYTVGRVLLFHDDYLQFYWNATGNDWSIPIRSARAVVTLPASVPVESVASTSYEGYSDRSTRGGPGLADPQGHVIFRASDLNPGEGLTIDLAIPREFLPIEPPSLGQRAVRFAVDNWYVVLPFLAFAFMLFLWFRVGRDPRKGVIPPAYEPPRGVGPGEAGVLIDDRIDLRDVSAMVIGLAVKGCLMIREEPPGDPSVLDRVKAWASRSEAEYTFVRGKQTDAGLLPAEKALFEGIFPDAETKEVPLSSLDNVFYKHLPTIRLRLYEGLIQRGYYPHNPEKTRRAYAGVAPVIFLGGIIAGINFEALYLGLAIGLCGLVVLAFAPFMPRKTKKGVEALVELLGLSEYIQRAEVDRMEFHDAPEKSPEVFERLLPYAVALNLTSIWTRQFEGLLREPPDWYGGASTFDGRLFGLSMARLSLGMQRTFVSAPRTASGGRTAWGGGGSFGGGFSGGGFGGGGGGGW